MKRYTAVTRRRDFGGDFAMVADHDELDEWRDWLALWRPHIRWSLVIDNETGLVAQRDSPRVEEAVAS